jgi:hypothetical protein
VIEQREYQVVVDQNEKGELVCKLAGPNPALDARVADGQVAYWSFSYSPAQGQRYLVHVYYGLSSAIPQGDVVEAIQRRAEDCILKSPEAVTNKQSPLAILLLLLFLGTGMIVANLISGARTYSTAMGGVAMIIMSLVLYWYARRRAN